MKLPPDFYIEQDCLTVAKSLLGKQLFTHSFGQTTGGIITETEAYIGPHDKASHAVGGRRTQRTEILFQPGGNAYIYLIYGIYNLLNATVGKEEVPECVLIRAIQPTFGIETMIRRRHGQYVDRELTPSLMKSLTDGPGKFSVALGITKRMYGMPLDSEKIWIEDAPAIDTKNIETTPRIGIDYAEEYKDKPWRFLFKNPSKAHSA